MMIPPLAALFLTYFDDIKGQCVVYYRSMDDALCPPGQIEHTTLPSGLHALPTDLILFTHGEEDMPGIGLFRSRKTGEGGRGIRMGTVGFVLAEGGSERLLTMRTLLEELYDQLESHSSPFSEDNVKNILGAIWEKQEAQGPSSSHRGPCSNMGQIRALVDGRLRVPADHPIAYMPSLFSILGPSFVTVYKAAIAGKRILLHSPPPLLPLGAFAWCIYAMTFPPPVIDRLDRPGEVCTWIGNIGLMRLSDLQKRKGGWVATTSDAIYRSRTECYDLFIDLSSPSHPTPTASSPPVPSSPSHSSPSTCSSTTLSPPDPSTFSNATLFISAPTDPIPISYTFCDLPLYRSLILLEHSPSSITVTSTLGHTGGIWLLVFELYERIWKLCLGVCEYAVGRGGMGGGQIGQITLGQCEEDARLLGGEDDLDLPPDDPVTQEPDGLERERTLDPSNVDGSNDTEDVNDAVRIGRLILAQLHHHTYHLHTLLRSVRGRKTGVMTESELKELVGKWTWGDVGGSPDGKWWIDLAKVWGLASDD